MRELELLAPARNADIGIAAIDCGADAVYMAGPRLGARKDAANSVADICRLCGHAHRYGARVFVTVNTIIFDEELEESKALVKEIIEAGADALIVQDMAVVEICEELFANGLKRIPLHASTQCAILDSGRAEFLAAQGFSRLILERELSLEGIKEIAAAAPDCEIEFFVHGALCVCYSGQCYMSEAISSRSANRGACIQACRSRYDLVDENGKVLVKDKALLSLKDYNLSNRLEDLAEAGVTSFKIEGRLKNESYVRNVVREYSLALDRLVAQHPDVYCRASFGKVVKAFAPALDKTFNRGYTELYIDGRRGKWASMDAAKGMGEEIGKIISVKQDLRRNLAVVEVERPDGCVLNNGDGFSFVAGNGDVIGFRGDVCESIRHNAARISCKPNDFLYKGARIFRNLDSAFEKEISRNPGTRTMSVTVDAVVNADSVSVTAISEDGRSISKCFPVESSEAALNTERLAGLVSANLSKTSGIYDFHVGKVEFNAYPLMSSAFINGIRRELGEALDAEPCLARPLSFGHKSAASAEKSLSYRYNVANHIAEGVYRAAGAASLQPAFELAHQKEAELMRTRYCIRHELGMCIKDTRDGRKLFLLNNGRRFPLHFDCSRCEMVVLAE